jgi:hypothetical protein
LNDATIVDHDLKQSITCLRPTSVILPTKFTELFRMFDVILYIFLFHLNLYNYGWLVIFNLWWKIIRFQKVFRFRSIFIKRSYLSLNQSLLDMRTLCIKDLFLQRNCGLLTLSKFCIFVYSFSWITQFFLNTCGIFGVLHLPIFLYTKLRNRRIGLSRLIQIFRSKSRWREFEWRFIILLYILWNDQRFRVLILFDFHSNITFYALFTFILLELCLT